MQAVSQVDGPHNAVFRTVEQMPAARLADYENILARLRGLPAYVDQAIALMDEQLAAGLAQPAVVVDLMLDQVSSQAATPALSSPLLAAFSTFPESMPVSTQRRLRASAVAAYQQQFVPSWNRLETYLRDRYKPRARPQVGLGAAPNGPAAYAQLVRFFTTTRMSADEIHQLGLEEVDRIEREMRAIAERVRLHRNALPSSSASWPTGRAASSRARPRCWPTPRTCWRACGR